MKDKILAYWEEQRKIAQEIKDEYDREMDEKYHRQFYSRFTRPDFFEPLNNKRETRTRGARTHGHRIKKQ